MLRSLIAPIVAAAFAAPAFAMDLQALSDEERALFRAEVRAYLLENPEVIIQAVNILQDKEAQAAAQVDFTLVSDNADAIFKDGYSWVGGNPEGDITLVEFLDYRCGYCKRAHSEVARLLEEDGNIRLIVKEFPILGDQSVLASRFAVATKQIAGDDSYHAMNDALMAFNGDISLPGLRRMANTFGLDADSIEAHMQSDEVSHEIAQTRALAQKLKISGTPTFVMQDEMLRGFLPFDQMLEMVREKRG